MQFFFFCCNITFILQVYMYTKKRQLHLFALTGDKFAFGHFSLCVTFVITNTPEKQRTADHIAHQSTSRQHDDNILYPR